jgi:hypothetical protein
MKILENFKIDLRERPTRYQEIIIEEYKKTTYYKSFNDGSNGYAYSLDGKTVYGIISFNEAISFEFGYNEANEFDLLHELITSNEMTFISKKIDKKSLGREEYE